MVDRSNHMDIRSGASFFSTSTLSGGCGDDMSKELKERYMGVPGIYAQVEELFSDCVVAADSDDSDDSEDFDQMLHDEATLNHVDALVGDVGVTPVNGEHKKALENLTRICRCCLSVHKDLQSLYENENCISDMIMAIASIELSPSDKMPSQICTSCVLQLSRAWYFKQLLVTADVTLRHYIDKGFLSGMKLVPLSTNLDDDDEPEIFDDEATVNLDNLDDRIANQIHNNIINDTASVEKQKFNKDLKQKISGDLVKHEQLPVTYAAKSQIIVSTAAEDPADEDPIIESVSWACFVCKKPFVDLVSLQRHKCTHNDTSSYQCESCRIIFVDYETLVRHSKEHAPVVDLQLPPGQQLLFSCADCNKMFRVERDLRIHQSIHRPDGKLMCNVCDKEVTNLIKLKRHISTHFIDKPYKCSACNMGFPERSALTRHYRFKHTNYVREKKLECQFCGKKYGDKHQLTVHTRNHTGERPYVCKDCGKTFTEERLMKIHQGRHSSNKPYTCPVCGRRFVRPHNMRLHLMRVHSGQRTAINLDNLDDRITNQIHNKNINNDTDSDEEQNFNNDLDQQIPDEFVKEETLLQPNVQYFADESDGSNGVYAPKPQIIPSAAAEDDDLNTLRQPLETHQLLRVKSEEEETGTNEDVNEPYKESDPTDEYPVIEPVSWACFVCKKSFAVLASLQRHICTHNETSSYQCKSCPMIFVNYEELVRHSKEHESVADPELFNCADCEMSFSVERHLRIHRSIHRPDGKLVCVECDKETTDLDHLKRHIRTHFEDKPHKCGVCDKDFAERSELTSHFRKKHTNYVHEKKLDKKLDKPYACTLCDRRYINKSNLKTHIRSHTGERPYDCTVCGKSFIHTSNLRLHMRIHTGEKPYQCNGCDKRFSTSSERNVHARIHTGEKPYECEVCHKRFRFTPLAVHMRTHTGEKPYACTTCPKRYCRKTQLINHVCSHTGETV